MTAARGGVRPRNVPSQRIIARMANASVTLMSRAYAAATPSATLPARVGESPVVGDRRYSTGHMSAPVSRGPMQRGSSTMEDHYAHRDVDDCEQGGTGCEGEPGPDACRCE